MEEDFNIPCAERKVQLERLQNAIGDVPIYFWAACQICDIKSLEGLADLACFNAAAGRLIAGQTQSMLQYCKHESLGYKGERGWTLTMTTVLYVMLTFHRDSNKLEGENGSKDRFAAYGTCKVKIL